MRALLSLFFVLLVACSPPPCLQDYGACEVDSHCGGGATCEELVWPYGQGNMCTRACENELDCPRTGGRAARCLDVGTGTFSCYQPCTAGTTCPEGWVCQPIRVDGIESAVCLP